MELVVDANIVFSALIKDSHTRHLLTSGKHNLHIPEFVLEELNNHLNELENKTGNSEQEMKDLLNQIVILGNIQVIPASEFKDRLPKANEISPDPNDVHYFALALKRGCSIWSNDKRLKEQKIVKVYTTEEVHKFI